MNISSQPRDSRTLRDKKRRHKEVYRHIKQEPWVNCSMHMTCIHGGGREGEGERIENQKWGKVRRKREGGDRGRWREGGWKERRRNEKRRERRGREGGREEGRKGEMEKERVRLLTLVHRHNGYRRQRYSFHVQ